MDKLEKLETLPIRESRKEFITREYGDMWNLSRFDHSWDISEKGNLPVNIAERIIKKYMGKSFDDAFSEYCKKVKIHQQKDFLDLFKDRIWNYADYMIDSEKRIQLNPNRYQRKKRPIKFRSFDYKEGYYNIVTKEIISKDNVWNQRYYLSNNNYIRVIVEGFERTFESKKDPEYQRLQAEKLKAEKRNKKLLKGEQKNRQYCFLTEKELKRKIVR